MARDLISSRATFFFKFAFPPAFALCLGAGMLPAFEISRAPGSALKWIAAAAWIAASTYVWRSYLRLKTVWIEGSNIVVANHGREEAIPFAAVRQIWDSPLSTPATIKIVLDESRGFGKYVVIRPPITFSLPGTEHPTAERLRKLIRERTGRAID